ncbi:MAG: type VI secretion system baseplate subunit TssG [Tannerella sp.]|jgi:hypothetical protein|nr:type VI secretion system baseplate subunit TssG [Tannerella sp.]
MKVKSPSLDLSKKQINSPDTDFKPEVVAASLIEQGFDPELIMIIRDGAARRGISKEVEEILIKFSDHTLQDYLHIKTNKEGGYDMLPQGLFHKPLYKKKFLKDKEEALEEIRIHREEEFFARKFFLLFEVMTDETSIEAQLFEIRYDKKISNPEFVNLFVQFWPILKLLEHRQAIFFMHIIPILHKVRSHHEEVEEALSCLLDVPVQISNIALPAKKASRFFESYVGHNEIGVDMVLGNTFDDGENDLKITVGQISANQMIDFIETGKGYILLEQLCDLFLPANAFVIKEFKILPEDSAFILSDGNNTTFLGVNSFI